MTSMAGHHTVTTINIPSLYPSCTWHSDCGTNQFCGVKCWTGGCDEAGNDRKGKQLGRFCQPCTKCKKYTDSSTRTCATCQVSGSNRMPSRICTQRCLLRDPWVACMGTCVHIRYLAVGRRETQSYDDQHHVCVPFMHLAFRLWNKSVLRSQVLDGWMR